MIRKAALLILMLSLLIPSQGLGSECPNAISLKVGDTVKDCDRIGLSKKYDLEVREELIENDFNKKIIQEQKRMLELKDLTISSYSDRSNIWEQEAKRSREMLDQERSRNDKWFWTGIASGIALTLGAAWGFGQVAR